MIKLGRKKVKAPASVLRGARLYMRLLMVGGVMMWLGLSNAWADLPVACGGHCGAAGGAKQWVSYGGATLSYTPDGKTMNIDQSQDKTILNWETFNIGQDNTVNFRQPSSSSVALNKVWDPNNNPSRILGHLNANGEVYLINRNGIVFGQGSQVQVHSLVASTLDVDDDVFKQGILTLTANDQLIAISPAFHSHDGRVNIVDNNGNEVLFARNKNGDFLRDDQGRLVSYDEAIKQFPEAELTASPYAVEVRVEDGAILTSDKTGRLMLLSQNVTNAGTIETPDGQAVLASGNKVYLFSSRDSSLRGLLVEVDVDQVSDEQLASFLKGETDPNSGQKSTLPAGNTTNSGTITSQRGNVTMVGLAVNQQGRVSATTAVSANGSVRLLARDKIDPNTRTSKRAGAVNLAENSLIDILPELESLDAVVDEQHVDDSKVEVQGQTIDMRSGSRIVAPSGQVTLSSVTNPSHTTDPTNPIPTNEDAWVNLHDGSSIDVSGSNIELSMDRNLVEVELRGNELKDSPLQRDGVLRGQKVTIDIRQLDENNHIPIADVSGAIANIKRTIGEKTTKAGAVTLTSEGSTQLQAGSKIDVSGGSITYKEGFLNTTKVTSEGRVYDLSTADPNRIYDGIVGNYTKTHQKWGVTESWSVFSGSTKGEYYPGYVEGAEAGKVTVAAPGLLLDGTLLGHVNLGPYQRQAYNRRKGGTLVIGHDSQKDNVQDYRAPNVNINNGASSSDSQADDTMQLSTDYLTSGGFTETEIYSNGRIIIDPDTPINVAPGGKFKLAGQIVEVNSDINVPSGDIELNAVQVNSKVKLADAPAGLIIADNIRLTTQGAWVNDAEALNFSDMQGTLLTAPALTDGGNIAVNLQADGLLSIGKNVVMDASGGAWLKADGRLAYGKGGDINLRAGANSRLEIGGDLALRSYSGTQGGGLTLEVPKARLSGTLQSDDINRQQQAWSQYQATFLSDQQKTALAADAQTVLAGGQLQAGQSSDYLNLVNDVVTKVKQQGGDTVDGPTRETLIQNAIADVSLSFDVPAFIFQTGGFSSYTISSSNHDLVVEQGTVIQPRMQNWVLDLDYQRRPSSGGIEQFSELQVLPDYLRLPVDLTLQVNYSSGEDLPLLDFQSGAQIITEPQAVVSLVSGGRMDINGDITTPAGQVNLTLKNEDGLYHADKILNIGPDSHISVNGAVKLQPDELGLRVGQVLDGGTIDIEAQGGYVVTASGSSLDVSGTTAELDINKSQNSLVSTNDVTGPVTVASNAGAILLQASEGLSINGTIKGNADKEHGAAGGRLGLSIDSSDYYRGGDIAKDSFPNGQHRILISQQPMDNSSQVDQTTSGIPSFDGTASLSSRQLTEGGFDQLTLHSLDGIDFSGDVALNMCQGITLDAPVITATNAADIELTSASVLLGPQENYAQLSNENTAAGNAQLNINAGFIELAGDTVVQGFKETHLNSSGDIRVRGLLDKTSNKFSGSFAAAGALNLTADQIYPATLTEFTISAVDIAGDTQQGIQGVSGTVTFGGGDNPTPVLSAGGKLTIDASHIINNGVLKAPLGEIILGSDGKTQEVTLGVNSVVSTSAQGQLIPFGTTQNGVSWFYEPEGGEITVYHAGEYNIPQQNIVISGANVNIAENSVIDMSGDGDLVSQEFIPGPGGSKDFLSNADPNKLFAIVPGVANGVAPYDPEIMAGAGPMQPGDSITLSSDVNDLPAGTYTVLPAKYALLPGAYLVSAVDGYQDIQPGSNVTFLDGTRIVSGRRTVSGTNIQDSRTSGFLVRRGDYAKNLAEYNEIKLSEFVTQHAVADNIPLPRLPIDSGKLTLQAGATLSLDGTVQANAGEGGKGGQMDIVASNIAIVTSKDQSSDAVQLQADELNRLGVESLLIGATRTEDADTTHIDVKADNVTVEQGVALRAPDLMLAAKDTVQVKNNAQLEGSGTTEETEKSVVLNGDGAFLQASAQNVTSVRRENSTAQSGGHLMVAAGVQIKSQRSITLDASSDTQSQAELIMEKGNLNLGAAKITLGQGDATASSGLVLTQDQLTKLSSLERLNLRSSTTIDLNGAVTVAADNLSIDAPGLAGHQGATDNALLKADKQLKLSNSSGVSDNPVTAQANKIEFSANDIILGPGKFGVTGFANTSLTASHQLRGEGVGGLTVSGAGTSASLDLTAGKITVATAADTHITADGDIKTHQYTTQPADASNSQEGSLALGGKLSLRGSGLQHGGTIEAASGVVSLQATDGDTVLLSGSSIDVSGKTVSVREKSVNTWGGDVYLGSESGNVKIQQGARVDLSGVVADNGVGSDAGRLTISAPGDAAGQNGRIEIGGDLIARALAKYRQGSFNLDANTLGTAAQDTNALTDLNATLSTGGFFHRRNIRLRSGDIVVEGDNLQATEVVLTADGQQGVGGSVIVNGKIDATADQGGTVTLNANNNIELNNGSIIDASASGDNATGGTIVLNAVNDSGTINIADGSNLDLHGGKGGKGGTLHLRAARKDTNGDGVDDDVNVAPIAGRVNGAQQTVLEAVKVQRSDTDMPVTNVEWANWKTDLNAFMNNAATIKARLDQAQSLGLIIAPGLELNSSGDISLNTDWDFSSWRFSNGDPAVTIPGYLTIRAAGDVNLNGSLSDGFANNTNQLLSGKSWSYTLVAGADLTSANAKALLPVQSLGPKGNLKLAKGKIIRSGTGDISLSAGRDVVLADQTSVIYTAGVPAVAASGNKNWMTQGGNIAITAARDVVGAFSDQLATNWLLRQGGEKTGRQSGWENTEWAVDLSQFQQNVGSFGGGDVNVSAGHDITNLSVVIPTTGKQMSDDHADIASWGGGDLNMEAGNDIASGVYVIGKGTGRLRALGDFTSGHSVNILGKSQPLYALTGLGNGSVTLEAIGDVNLETVFNPTILPPANGTTSYLFSYNENSQVNLLSLGGDVVMQHHQSNNFRNIFSSSLSSQDFGSAAPLALFPGTVKAAALQGSITVKNSIDLFPSATGTLEFLAQNDINLGDDTSPATVYMSNSDPGLLPYAVNPSKVSYGGTEVIHPSNTVTYEPLHTGDPNPIYLIANTGDINGGFLTLPKKAEIIAGRDITNMILNGQNVDSSDVTHIEAGRDIRYTNINNKTQGIELAGPGNLEVFAGRNIDLGQSGGITTIGNTNNPTLSQDGASVTVMAGLQTSPDYAAFIDTYFIQQDGYKDTLRNYMAGLTGDTQLSNEEALTAFQNLPVEQQRPLIIQSFFNELRDSGRAAAGSGSNDYSRGYEAINTLFPSQHYEGDISMFQSRIYTVDGGDINILVPGGGVNAGGATSSKKPSELGIVAQGPGSVRTFTDGDFIVNQSRVFTLQGGDIMMWSTNGNIDAGRGAKSAISAPAPTITYDAQGNIQINFSSTVKGSGIRAIITKEGIPPGDVDLFAPKGVVDSGDAGIGSAGNLTIGATQVIGAENIDIGGVSVGVPVADTGSLAAGLTGVSNLSSSVSKSAEDNLAAAQDDQVSDTPISDAALTFLDVQVLGFGDTGDTEDKDKEKDKDKQQ